MNNIKAFFFDKKMLLYDFKNNAQPRRSSFKLVEDNEPFIALLPEDLLEFP